MTEYRAGWADERLERIIGALLQAGLTVSGLLVVIGGAVELIRHGTQAPQYRVFLGEPTNLSTVRGIVAHALAGHGRGIIQMGLLLLIATPVARVAFSAVGFLLERDWLYVVVTLLVLAVLIFSLAGGHF
jgi:uncharacterized membrane protein